MADVNDIPSVALTETVSQILIYSLEFLDKEKTVVFFFFFFENCSLCCLLWRGK